MIANEIPEPAVPVAIHHGGSFDLHPRTPVINNSDQVSVFLYQQPNWNYSLSPHDGSRDFRKDFDVDL
jgi:hypothetical protein